ncbi:PEPxxWA-CTERM sorting domain-containing protein [Phenylobacterium sp.]|uniref:PEPxxWA-CTERM sorting domain-containing protein n=1 Tax=Phenylobacterium sp. TaxID=1871053 RepID=UPI00374CE437
MSSQAFALGLAGAITLAAVAGSAAGADFLTIVRTSATTVNIDFQVGGFSYSVTGLDELNGLDQTWETPELPLYVGLAADPYNITFDSGGGFWSDPGVGNGQAEVVLRPSGNRGTTRILIYGGGPVPGDLGDTRCEVNSTLVSCPTFANGQTWAAPELVLTPLAFVPGTINVTYAYAAAGVPEPATWALLIAGFGLAGVALRRRRLVHG